MNYMSKITKNLKIKFPEGLGKSNSLRVELIKVLLTRQQPNLLLRVKIIISMD
jgi:hypothetical protein